MSNEALFQWASAAVLPGWLALASLPLFGRRRWLAIGLARWLGAGLSGLYVALLLAGLAGEGPPAGAGFGSLAGVRALMASEPALLAGWVHYLVFDLWVGSWEAEDAASARVPHLLLLPCLALTFLAGPTGLLLYLMVRAAGR